jgi:hypothetical protein
VVEAPFVDRRRVVEAALFVPKPSHDADCQRYGVSDLGIIVL